MSHSRSRRRRRPYEQQLRSPSPELSSDGGDVSSLSETTVTNSVAALPGDVSLNDIANMLAGLNLSLTISPTPVREVREYEDAPTRSASTFRPAVSGSRTAPSTPRRAPRPPRPVAAQPPQQEWVTPRGPWTNKPRFYIVKRGRCCGIFWKWPFTEQLVKNTQTGQFWPNTSYRREDNLEEAWAEYQRAKLAGEVYLVARQPGDRDLFGPEDLCVM